MRECYTPPPGGVSRGNLDDLDVVHVPVPGGGGRALPGSARHGPPAPGTHGAGGAPGQERPSTAVIRRQRVPGGVRSEEDRAAPPDPTAPAAGRVPRAARRPWTSPGSVTEGICQEPLLPPAVSADLPRASPLPRRGPG